MDEPGAFLDVRAQFELLDLLRSVAAGGKAVVLVMHELPQAMQYADCIALLGGGRLLGCDTSADLAAPVRWIGCLASVCAVRRMGCGM